MESLHAWKTMLFVICFAAISRGQARAQLVSDDFNDNVTSPQWGIFILGTGPTTTEVNQRVEIDIPGNSQGASVIAAGYASNGSLSGDFDVRVDYALLTWPPASNAGVGFVIFSPIGLIQVVRSSSAGGESYEGQPSYRGQPPVPTADQAGTLRIARCGGTLAGYYMGAGGWVQFFSNAGIAGVTGDLQINLLAGSTDPAIHQTVKVAFDNFIVNQAQVDCPAVCGDGVVQTGEPCDDGNTSTGDGCCACQLEPLAHADASGSWQMNMDCGATSSILISENPTSGALTWSNTGCGTLFLDGAIHKFACDTTPAPVQGQVCGNVLQVPAGGFFVGDSTLETPYASPLCTPPPLEEIIAQGRFDSSVVVDGSGKATRITGTSTSNITLRNTLGENCFSIDGFICNFVMLRNEVPPGNNQTVEPVEGATVMFPEVSSGGTTSITPLTTPDGELPANFQLLGTPVFYDVTTTATVSGLITLVSG